MQSFKKYIYTFPLLAAVIFNGCKNDDATKVVEGESVKTEIADPMLQQINDALAKDSTNASAWFAKGKYYMNRKDYDQSIAPLERATQLDSTKKEYYLSLADACYFANQTFGTKTALEKLVALYPEDETGNFKLAELMFYVKHYDDAMKYASKVTKINPENLQGYFLQGMIQKEKGDTAQAIKFFTICTDKNAKNYDAYMQLGILNSAKRNKIALEYFNSALKLNPNSTEAEYAIAMYYQELPDYDKAIETYTAMIQKNPNNRDALFNLGYIHQVNLNVPKQAIKHYNDLIAKFPQDYKAIYNRGVCFEKLGDINAAKLDYQKAIDIMPSYNKAREGLKRVMR